MPGEVIECIKCKHQMRWGYPTHSVQFALSKQPNATEKEIIDDFFHFNPGILKKKPEKCAKCSAEAGLLKTIHEYQ